jgi:hypothetical protein
MRALRFFASLSVALSFTLAGCSLVLDTDPPDPIIPPDSGALDLGDGRPDLGPPDLGAPDLGAPDLGAPDLGPADAGAADGDVEPVDGGPVDAGCVSNAQCDDGVFCNGVETCEAGACVVSPTVCPDADGVACTVPSCDAVLDVCVETASAGLCAAGSYCDPVEGCTVTPDCVLDTDCVPPDLCTVGTCAAGTCNFAPLDCTLHLPPLIGGDCRTRSCDPLIGCVYAPVPSVCDDGIGCTADLCRMASGVGFAAGTCAHEPRPVLCNDGAECTADTCDPTATCASGGVVSGCRHTPNHPACGSFMAATVTAHPNLACATPVCVGATAGNPSGCGFEGGCPSGQICSTSGGSGLRCALSTTTTPCSTDLSCDDGNPCNGTERCAPGVGCAPALNDICTVSPGGLTILGTCAFSATGPICAPPAELCALPLGP